MTAMPETLRLCYFLTVTTLERIAPRLLGYLQPNSCREHLQKEWSSLKKWQELAGLLLSSHWPSSCVSSGLIVGWDAC